MPWLIDWMHLLARWFHLVVGAAWIGTSFYFNWLNNNIRPVEDRGEGLAGQLWSVHGGAFYRVQKFKGAPERLPDTLHWFKFEAYLTWVSGIALLLLVYWSSGKAMMLPPGSSLSEATAAGIGVGSLVLGWLVYDGLCRSPLARRPVTLALVGAALLVGAAWSLSQLLTARAAYIHLGAMMGTMMALNVFFVIIPGQRAMVDAMARGEAPDTSRGAAGALRSLHNNYFTLPVLFIMVSNHFPFTYGHPYGWAVLAGLAVIGAAVRHWFNLRGRGELNAWILPAAALAMVALALVTHGPRPAPSGEVPDYAEIDAILESRCRSCHAAEPSFPAYSEPPNGLILEDPEVVAARAESIRAQAVSTQVMPLGNLTAMTEEERATLGRWIDAGAPLP